MSFKLPGLHKLVSSNKKLDFAVPQKLIHVVNGYAFVNNDITAIVNVREYVKKELSLESEDDFENLTKIIEWMNGKSFTKEFWSILTKECLLEVEDESSLKISNGQFTTILTYEDIVPTSNLYLEVVETNIKRDIVNIETLRDFEKATDLMSKK